MRACVRVCKFAGVSGFHALSEVLPILCWQLGVYGLELLASVDASLKQLSTAFLNSKHLESGLCRNLLLSESKAVKGHPVGCFLRKTQDVITC